MIPINERVDEEIRLLGVRYEHLDRKAHRLPLNSNGRQRAKQEQMRLIGYAVLLERAKQGEQPPKLHPTNQRHLRRAYELLEEMREAA